MSEIVKQYYDNNAQTELKRLSNPYSNIEFKSTMYLIEKYFPKEGHILDIGSGPGRYSIELLKKGYRVSLMELSQNELDIAKERIEHLDLKAEEYICNDAIDLHILEDEKYDAILLMGPMYHLLDNSSRKKVLDNTKRILKNNGIVLIAYLNSWGILKAGVTEFSEVFSDINNVYGYLGEQNLSAERSFTEVYFSTPPRAIEEVEGSDFEIISYAGAEGFLSGIENEIIKLYEDNQEVYNNLVKVAVETCEYKQYRDATEHLHIVARKIG